MDSKKIGGIVRAMAGPLLAYAAAKGWIVDSATSEAAIVVMTAIATAIWSLWSKREPAS